VNSCLQLTSEVIESCRYALTVWFSAAAPRSICAPSPPQQPDQAQQQQGETAGGSIFVSVAAFRDPEARWTVCDLLAKAARPDAVKIGVVWQVDFDADAAMLHVPCDPARRRQVLFFLY
jgi:hypothetical protein